LAAGGAAVAFDLPRASAAEQMKPGGWYALVSDIHIPADPALRKFGQYIAENFRAVVADILSVGGPLLGVFISGDLALWDGKPDDYRTLISLLEPLREAKVPIHLALGNHDNRDNFRAALPAETPVVDKLVSTVEGPGLRFVVLDSLEHAPFVHGSLGPAQLDWLRRDLDAHPATPTILLVHHHPETIHWAIAKGLSDTAALMEIVLSRHQVKALVFGHNHAWKLRKSSGTYLLNLPAVAYTFGDSHQPLGWCRFRPEPQGAWVEVRCVGGNRRVDRHKLHLTWERA
jgi:3',5'-cyclic AMP phosphodiesterase CpdA